MTNTTLQASTIDSEVPSNVRNAMADLVDMLWDREYDDFLTFGGPDHPLILLCIVRGWLIEQQVQAGDTATSSPAECTT